jgi:hypothetical protein
VIPKIIGSERFPNFAFDYIRKMIIKISRPHEPIETREKYRAEIDHDPESQRKYDRGF